MIKETDRIDEYEIYEVSCDSCHVIIGECQKFEYREGQELVYSPILCEECGTLRSKDHGDKTKRIYELEKMVLDYKDLAKKLIDNIADSLKSMENVK